METYQYKITDQFICAIEYGDYTGLSDEEEAQIDNFLASVPSQLFSYSEESHFAKCDVCGLYAQVLDVTVTVL